MKFLPLAAGVTFSILFFSLGLWQIDRADEKEEMLALFEDDRPYTPLRDPEALQPFERISATGRYLNGRQVLIDNMLLDGRLGYYVITPFRPADGGSLLLVNRGWVPGAGPRGPLPDVAVHEETVTVHGLAGHLPRAAMHPGEPFEYRGNWPRVAVFPGYEDVANEIDAAVMPVVLLLAPGEADGYERRWQPNVAGPAKHYSYAFQWFAMSLAVMVLVVLHGRKRFKRER